MGEERINLERNEEIWYYVYDGHGNVRALTDENGVITDSYTYDAYGILLTQNGNTENDYLYCGEQYNASTGLYYLRARYMNPSTGTFISMDSYQGSIHDPVSLHKYLYANANPVTYKDPSGYCTTLVQELVGFNIWTIIQNIQIADVIGVGLSMLATVGIFKAAERARANYIYELDKLIEGLLLEEETESIPEDAKDEVEDKAEEGVEDEDQETLDEKTPKDISDMTRKELKEKTPDNWEFHDNKGRIHIKDENGNYRIRIDPPDQKTDYTHIHIYDKNGNPVDINGNPVSIKDPAGHIPYNY